ncbi:MAG: LysE family translocator [Candidatus Velthaea sp.]
MVDAQQLAVFVPVVIVIALLPGQDMLFVLAQSMRGGTVRGLVAMLGILTAFFFVHVAGAALGLSAIIVKSALLFNAIKYAGALYLLYLGLKTLVQRNIDAHDERAPQRGRVHDSPFIQGFITNVLNPKVAIFMLAFLPQFIVPSHGNVALQIVVLGAIWGVAGVIILGAVAFAGASIGAVRKRSPLVRNIEKYVTGSIFVGLGLRVALPEHR